MFAKSSPTGAGGKDDRGPLPNQSWHLYAINCRTNHVHVVVTADRHPDDVRDQFKAWCTRRLREQARTRGELLRKHWWTERGSSRYINDDYGLECAIRYVNEAQ